MTSRLRVASLSAADEGAVGGIEPHGERACRIFEFADQDSRRLLEPAGDVERAGAERLREGRCRLAELGEDVGACRIENLGELRLRAGDFLVQRRGDAVHHLAEPRRGDFHAAGDVGGDALEQFRRDVEALSEVPRRGVDADEHVVARLFQLLGDFVRSRLETGEDDVVFTVDMAEQAGGRLIEAACECARGVVELLGDPLPGSDQLVGHPGRNLFDLAEQLIGRFLEPGGHVARAFFHVVEELAPRPRHVLDEVAGGRQKPLGKAVARNLDLLRHLATGPLHELRDGRGRLLDLVVDVAAGRLQQGGEMLGRRPQLLVERVRHLVDRPLRLCMQGGKFGHALLEGLDDARLHRLHGLAEVRAFEIHVAAGVRQGLDLVRDVVGEALHLGQEHRRHLLHARRLAADLVTDQRGAGRDFVDRMGKLGRRRLQALLEGGKGSLGGVDDAVEMLGILLQPAEQGGGLRADDESRLVQRLALGFEPGDQVANPFLVASERTFDGGHLLVHELFELGRTRDGLLDAVDQEIDFLAHRLSHRRQAFGRDVLRPDEAHRRLHERFRNLAQLLGAIEEVGRRPRKADGQEHHHGSRHQLGQVAGGEEIALPQQDRPVDSGAGEDPGQRHGEGDPERRRRRPALDVVDDRGGGRLVLVRRRTPHGQARRLRRSFLMVPIRIAPGGAPHASRITGICRHSIHPVHPFNALKGTSRPVEGQVHTVPAVTNASATIRAAARTGIPPIPPAVPAPPAAWRDAQNRPVPRSR